MKRHLSEHRTFWVIFGLFLISVVSITLYAGIDPTGPDGQPLEPCEGSSSDSEPIICITEECPNAGEEIWKEQACEGCDPGDALVVTSGVDGVGAVWIGNEADYSIDAEDWDKKIIEGTGTQEVLGVIDEHCNEDWGEPGACDGETEDMEDTYAVFWDPVDGEATDTGWVEDTFADTTTFTAQCIGSVEISATASDDDSVCENGHAGDETDDALPKTVWVVSVNVESQLSGEGQYTSDGYDDCGNDNSGNTEWRPGIVISYDREDNDNDGIAGGDHVTAPAPAWVSLRGHVDDPTELDDVPVSIFGFGVAFSEAVNTDTEIFGMWLPSWIPEEDPDKNVYFRGIEPSATEGEGTVILWGGGEAIDMISVTVVDIDLQMQGLPETGDPNEITPGGIVKVNDDDDNNNSTKDNEEPYNANDNDFVPMTLSLAPSDMSRGKVKFTIESGGEHVRVFRQDGDAWVLVEGSYTFDLGSKHPPFNFMVDGKSMCAEGGVVFRAEYMLGEDTVTSDVVKCRVSAVDVMVNEVDDEYEEDSGAYIMVNDADTHHKKIYQTSTPGTATSSLVPIVLKFPKLDTGAVTLSCGSTKVKVWDSADKSGQEIQLPKTWDLSETQQREYTYYVEGVAASGTVRDVSFKLKYTGDQITDEDNASVTIIQIDLEGVLLYPFQQGNVVYLKEESDDGTLPDEFGTGMFIRQSNPGDDTRNSYVAIYYLPLDLDQGTLNLTINGNAEFVDLAPPAKWDFSTGQTPPLFVDVKGKTSSVSLRDTTIKLGYTCDPPSGLGIARTDEIKATIVKVDVEMQSLPEEGTNQQPNEESPGGLIPQRSLVIEPIGTKPSVRATLSILPADLASGQAILNYRESSRIDVTADDDGSNSIQNGIQWNLNQIPAQVYVLGNAASSSVGDSQVELMARFVPAAGYTIEMSDYVYLTVFNLDLVAGDLTESQEMEPGAIIQLNNDNDNNNTVADRNENPVQDEDDLVELKLNIIPGTLDLGTASLVGYGDTSVRLWDDHLKTNQPATLEWQPPRNAPTSLWVEGYKLSNYDSTAQPPEQPNIQRKLALEYEPGKKAVDQINATVGVIDLHFYRGEGPHAPPDEDAEELIEENAPGLLIGVPDAAIDMDDNGYPDIEDGYVIESDYDAVLDTSELRLGHLHLMSLKSLPTGTVKLKRIASESEGDIRVYVLYAEYNESDQRKEVAVRVMDEDDEESGDIYSYLVESGDSEMFGPIEDGVFIGIEGVTPGQVVLEATYTESSTGQKITDKAIITVASIDMDIDSDNNNGIALPSRTQAEDDIEDTDDHIGRIVKVNSTDEDGDLIPDFADGFGALNLSDESDKNSINSKFVPLIVAIPVGQNVGKMWLKFEYDAAEPIDTTRSGSAPNYHYNCGTGSLRLWRADGNTPRNLNPIQAGPEGHFIAAGVAVEAQALGINDANRSVVLYVEAVCVPPASKGAAARQIKVHICESENGSKVASDVIRVAPVELRLVQLDRYGGASVVTHPTGTSQGPTINTEICQLTNIRFSSDKLSIIGDIRLAGTIKSSTCDLAPGSLGEITAAHLFVNRDSAPLCTLPVDSEKGLEPTNPIAPYPYTGYFDTTVVGVPLQEGVNQVELWVEEPVYGMVGYVQSTTTVTVTPPDPVAINPCDVQTTISFGDIHDLANLTPETPVAFSLAYGGNSLNTTLYRTSAESFELSDGTNSVYILNSDDLQTAIDQTRRGSFEVKIWAPGVILGSFTIPVKEPNASANQFVTDVVEVTIDGIFNSSNVDQISLKIKRNNGAWNTSIVTETGADTRVFTDMSGDVSVTIGEGLSPGDAPLYKATITHVGLDLLAHDAIISESTANSYQTPDTVQSTSVVGYADCSVSSTPLTITDDTGPGEVNMYSLSVELPSDSSFNIDEFVQTIISHEIDKDTTDNTNISLDLMQYDGKMLITRPSADMPLAMIFSQPTLTNIDSILNPLNAQSFDEYVDQLRREDESGVGAFSAGFSVGVYRGARGTVVDTWDLLKMARNGAVDAVAYCFVMEYWMFTGDPQFKVEIQKAQHLAQQVQELISTENINKMATALWRLWSTDQATREAIWEELVAGDWEGAWDSAGHYRLAVEVAAELFDAVREDFVNRTDYEKGVVTGQVVFEVATVFIGITKAGKVSKIAKLQELAEKSKFFKAGGLGARAMERVLSLLSKYNFHMCFAPGTLVHTAEGTKPIEQIRTGDWVLTRSPTDSYTSLQPVTATIVTHPDVMYHITYRPRQPRRVGHPRGEQSEQGTNDDDDGACSPSDERLSTTGEHPFYVVGRSEFIPAKELAIGHELALVDGRTAVVTRIEIESSSDDQPFTTYNLEINESHTYFVGEKGVWVHNKGMACERIASIYGKLRHKDNLSPFEAWLKFLEKTSSPARRRIVDQNLRIAAREMSIDIYKEAGTDVSKWRTYSGFWNDVNAETRRRLTSNGLQVHHGLPIYVQNLLGIPPSEIDKCPGVLLEISEHMDSTEEIKSLHSILYKYIPKSNMHGYKEMVSDGITATKIKAKIRVGYEEWAVVNNLRETAEESKQAVQPIIEAVCQFVDAKVPH